MQHISAITGVLYIIDQKGHVAQAIFRPIGKELVGMCM
jgi:hypothetical protein